MTNSIRQNLDHTNASVRLRAALDAGTVADPAGAAALIARCAVEPDFFVRDMLTWALTRLPAGSTVPLLAAELDAPVAQARSQALHTLSKIGGAEAAALWPVALRLVNDADTEVAKAAWRTVVGSAPQDEHPAVARALVAQLGRGDLDAHRSLSRAIVVLGAPGLAAVRAVAEHAAATIRLAEDPDAGFAIHEARRVAALGEHA